MTDEERQKRLLDDLLLMLDAQHYGPLYRRAADEIERLVQERNVWVKDGETAWRKVLELSRVEDTRS